MILPDLFIQRIQKDFQNQAKQILEGIYSNNTLSTFRLNPNKMSAKRLKEIFPDETLKPISIGENIFSTEKKTLYTKNPLIFSGAYYFQDLASMLPTLILDVHSDQVILDACASPGSKSTHIMSFLGDQGKLIVNEINKTRVGRLIENIARWGTTNIFICSQDTRKFTPLAETFDKILVDAPCSGEGMFYKSEESLKEWTPRLSKKLSHLQKQILENLLPTLKVGGELVYSTCTLSIEENEMVVDDILKKYADHIELVDFSDSWEGGEQGLPGYDGIVFQEEVPKYTRRILPHHQDFKGEAFFIAKFRILSPIKSQKSDVKPRYQNYWDIPKKVVQSFLKEMKIKNVQTEDIFALGHFLYFQKSWSKTSLKEMISLLHPVYVGCRLGTLKKDWVEPATECATSLFSSFSEELILDLNTQEIEKYLLAEQQNIRRENFIPGFKLITYCEQPIGFGKLGTEGTLKSFFKASQGKKVF